MLVIIYVKGYKYTREVIMRNICMFHAKLLKPPQYSSKFEINFNRRK